MNLTPNEKYELKAEAFRQMTGLLAPGKDSRLGDGEVRRAAWEVWNTAYGPAVNALLAAIEAMESRNG